MKQNQIPIFLAVSLFTVFILQAQMAQAAATCGPQLGIYCNATLNKDLVSAIITVIKYLFSIIGLFSLVFMVIAGIKYMTSAGSEQQITSAKDSFSSAVFGLVVALMAYGILDVIYGILN
jgi:hypothetical protein